MGGTSDTPFCRFVASARSTPRSQLCRFVGRKVFDRGVEAIYVFGHVTADSLYV